MQQLPQETLSFKEFTLNLTRGCLLRGDEEIRLRPKTFETLRHLVENSGRLVSKNELMAAVWPDTAVTDDSLVQCLIEIRRALGENGQQMVKTVPRRGYIFDVEVTRNHFGAQELIYSDETEGVSVTIEEEATDGFRANTLPARRRHWFQSSAVQVGSILILVAAVLIIWVLWRNQSKPAIPEIKTLAVLPFRSQTPDNQENYLGLGIANEIITKVSQTGALTVRPTSAVRKYVTQDTDALTAARELQVDAVVDGTYLHVGDQLRITVSLIRVTDGASLWAEKFDQRFTDIFAIQDQVSKQVAQRLRLTTSPTEQAKLSKRHTGNPLAYSYYAAGMYHYYNIGPSSSSRSESELAVDLFKKAIELDPQYALAHAQLGYTYTRIAVFLKDSSELIDQAKQELGTAEKLDPQLAEVHLARYFAAFSHYEGWSVDKALRELRLAQQLNPAVGHLEMVDLYSHIGLEEETTKEFELTLSIDPNNEEVKDFYINAYYISGRPDEGLEASKRFFNRAPDLRYYVEKGMVKEAEPLAQLEYKKDPNAVWKFVYQILLKAMQNKHEEAQSAVTEILSKERRYRGYHHDTYNIARIYALGGKSDEALKWLRTTVTEGFPHYPLFERDPFLNPIREDADFKQFMSEMKAKWEGYKRMVG